MSDAVRQQIAEIPRRDDGWWHSANLVTYLRLADRLLAHGITPEEVVDILTDAYNATADEYGD